MKVGQTVQLNSGGPVMTVSNYPYCELGFTYDDRAECVWFENHQLQKAVFPIDTLTIVDK